MFYVCFSAAKVVFFYALSAIVIEKKSLRVGLGNIAAQKQNSGARHR